MQNFNEIKFLELIQITNSNFPNGSFSHSYGFETLIRNDHIIDKSSLLKYAKCYLKTVLASTDLLAIIHCYKHHFNLDELSMIDEIMGVSGMSKEVRDANVRIASQMIKVFLELYPKAKILKNYYELMKSKKCYGHPALVFSSLCHFLKVDLDTALYAYAYSTMNTLIQNCVRAIPLGQLEGQTILHQMIEEIHQTLPNIKLWNFDNHFAKSYLDFEINQMDHEYIHIRLFMS